MKIVERAIDAVVPYVNNPRKNEAAIDKVAGSISEFGWQQPIVVDKDGVIVVGHTRLLAARKLGLAKVPVVVADHLSPAQIKAYRIADNKTGEFSDWDYDLLAIELSDLEGQFTGFSEAEMRELVHGPDFGASTQGAQPDLGELEPKMVTCPHCGEDFDVRKA